jgi:hypothetical protein
MMLSRSQLMAEAPQLGVERLEFGLCGFVRQDRPDHLAARQAADDAAGVVRMGMNGVLTGPGVGGPGLARSSGSQ